MKKLFFLSLIMFASSAFADKMDCLKAVYEADSYFASSEAESRIEHRDLSLTAIQLCISDADPKIKELSAMNVTACNEASRSKIKDECYLYVAKLIRSLRF
ncbi:MAG: hypothetical protein AB7I27_15285 [Bacteriovoracaceae bacterium]